MRSSRLKFKYAFRACKARAEQLEADSIAQSLAELDCRKFWDKIRRSSGPKTSVAASIDGVTGNEEITNLWCNKILHTAEFSI